MSFDITVLEYGVMLAAMVMAANVAENEGDDVTALAIRSTIETLTCFSLITSDEIKCPPARDFDENMSSQKQNCGEGAKGEK